MLREEVHELEADDVPSSSPTCSLREGHAGGESKPKLTLSHFSASLNGAILSIALTMAFTSAITVCPITRDNPRLGSGESENRSLERDLAVEGSCCAFLRVRIHLLEIKCPVNFLKQIPSRIIKTVI
jgi:hypothetical protein